jgi:hypothetical protein
LKKERNGESLGITHDTLTLKYLGLGDTIGQEKLEK